MARRSASPDGKTICLSRHTEDTGEYAFAERGEPRNTSHHQTRSSGRVSPEFRDPFRPAARSSLIWSQQPPRNEEIARSRARWAESTLARLQPQQPKDAAPSEKARPAGQSSGGINLCCQRPSPFQDGASRIF